jgi:hypothetical protein
MPRASQIPLLPLQPLRAHRPKRLARLAQHGQGVLRRADQARLKRADQCEVEEPLGLGADRLRVGGRRLELRDQRPALVQEREEPLHEGNGARSGLLMAPPTVAGKTALCNARPMPRPRREPSPDERQATLPLAKAPARRATPTPEAIAKKVTESRPEPGRDAGQG